MARIDGPHTQLRVRLRATSPPSGKEGQKEVKEGRKEGKEGSKEGREGRKVQRREAREGKREGRKKGKEQKITLIWGLPHEDAEPRIRKLRRLVTGCHATGQGKSCHRHFSEMLRCSTHSSKTRIERSKQDVVQLVR